MRNYNLFSYGAILILLISIGYAFILQKRETKKLRQQLKELIGKPSDDVNALGKFSEFGLIAAGMTHEISNPLSVILIKVGQLMKSVQSNERHPLDLEYGLNQIKSNAERIKTIIKSVREYIYQIEGSPEDFIPLREIIDNALVFYGQRLKNHGIELRLKNIDNVYISGQKGQYEQAILTLLSNSFDAIDHLPEKWIEISALNAKDNVQIIIKDSGPGIPVNVRQKMLEPFFTTKKDKGTGLGLSLVRGIAKNNGGELKYLEAPHTTFVLELPQASALLYHH